ncbi:MAG: 1,4-dihydroxy-2-naphthoate polyprenyltransferase [Ilumatobacteraceae bacterium]
MVTEPNIPRSDDDDVARGAAVPSRASRPTWRDWIAGARPRTLPAAVVPVAVGAAVGIPDGVSWWRVLGALAVALALQVGVNYANDYSDGVRGTDDVRVGPMRLVATGTASPGAVRSAALIALGGAAVVGTVLAATTTWWLLAIGAAALLAAWGYTGGPRPYGYLGLGEIFVFVFFGLVATAGTTYLAIGSIPRVSWIGAIGVGALACALLVVNNLRDIPTDEVAGKRTLAVRMGDRRTRAMYAVLMVGAFVCVAFCAGDRPWALLALAGVGAARDPIQKVLGGADGRDLVEVLGATGRTQLVTGLLLAIGLALG